jgi:hypothetical protein
MFRASNGRTLLKVVVRRALGADAESTARFSLLAAKRGSRASVESLTQIPELDSRLIVKPGVFASGMGPARTKILEL